MAKKVRSHIPNNVHDKSKNKIKKNLSKWKQKCKIWARVNITVVYLIIINTYAVSVQTYIPFDIVYCLIFFSSVFCVFCPHRSRLSRQLERNSRFLWNIPYDILLHFFFLLTTKWSETNENTSVVEYSDKNRTIHKDANDENNWEKNSVATERETRLHEAHTHTRIHAHIIITIIIKIKWAQSVQRLPFTQII